MDPNSGGSPPIDISQQQEQAVAAALANFNAASQVESADESKLQSQPPSTTAPPEAKHAPTVTHERTNVFAMYSTDSSSGGDNPTKIDKAPKPVFEGAVSTSDVKDGGAAVSGEATATKTNDGNTTSFNGTNDAAMDFKSGSYATMEVSSPMRGGMSSSAPVVTRTQLQAIVNEQAVNVRVKLNNEIIVDDCAVDARGKVLWFTYLSLKHNFISSVHSYYMFLLCLFQLLEEMERSLSSSTNTSAHQDQGNMDTAEYPAQEHPSIKTRSTSFDIAQAMVNSAINNIDQDTNTTSSCTNPPAQNDFADASLLLGLTEGSQVSPKPVRGELEPATLPSAMTMFLDMLNEDQRRVRHRHIPVVEGFRKLYKSEIKQDLAVARSLNKKSKSKRGGADDMMDVDDEEKDSTALLAENASLAEVAPAKADGARADTPPDSNAFIAPSENTIAFAHCGQLASLMESTPFENSMRGGLSALTLRSPQLVESLTAFNPPRPQESSAMKTKHRLKRWESNPQDVEVDLLNYKKTVQRTRMELHRAEEEHEQIESVTSMMRTHFMNHLDAYREEIAAISEQLQGTKSMCFKAAEEYSGKSISTRGSSKSMKDTFATLKNLGDELGAKAAGSGNAQSSLPDWRVSGLGGITAFEEDVAASKDPSLNSSLANGWILFGDKVKTLAGEEGTVVRFYAPSFRKTPPEDNSSKKGPLEKTGDSKATDSAKTKNETAAKSEKESSTLADMIVPSGITVHLSNGNVKTFPPSELILISHDFHCANDADLVKRWESMAQSAAEGASGHDYFGMNAQVISSILKGKQEEDNDGSASPKSVAQYDDLRNVVPFGAGLMSAPEQIKNFSSFIPASTLEENVRKTVYEGGKGLQVGKCLVWCVHLDDPIVVTLSCQMLLTGNTSSSSRRRKV
jgi:hypothetical protein